MSYVFDRWSLRCSCLSVSPFSLGVAFTLHFVILTAETFLQFPGRKHDCGVSLIRVAFIISGDEPFWPNSRVQSRR